MKNIFLCSVDNNELMQWNKLQRIVNPKDIEADKVHPVEIMEMAPKALPENIKEGVKDKVLPSEESESIRKQYTSLMVV